MLFEAVSDHGGTLTWLPNFAFNHCAQSIPDRHLQGVDLSSWRGVINCSEPMFLSSHRAFITRFAPYGLRPASLATCYAMAENVFAVTQSELSSPVSADRTDPHTLAQSSTDNPADGRPSQVEGHLSAGRPLANCRVKTVGDDGLPVGERQIGEIAIQSDCLLSGYYQRPDATSAAFRDGWFMTGDLGYVAAGEVYITGRKKDVIIVGGKNIYPQDLEEIANRVRGVKPGRCVAFGIPDPAMGTEEIVIVAEKDMDDNVADDRLEMELRKAVASSTDVALGRVKIVGSRWLVKTSSGKLARRANREKFLKDLALGGSPEES
jgi:acyl-CoA synthetase (AMP-forming)/AMP-acid ligase II